MTQRSKVGVASLVLGLALSLNVNAGDSDSVDEKLITTPQQAIQALKDGNERFMSNNMLEQDWSAQIKATAGGQAPFAGILSCLDSRVPPEIVFDQGIGDIFVARVAGNVEDNHILGSFEYAAAVVNIKLLVVMGHTSCGAVGGACEGVELGNLTELLAQIQPAVDVVESEHPGGAVCETPLVDDISKENVLLTIQGIRDRSPVLVELEKQGKLKLVGAMYDVSTGKVTWL